MPPLPCLPRIVGRQNNRKNVPARTPEEYCRRAVFLQDFAFKFSKIFRGLHANSHGGRRVQPHNAKYHFFNLNLQLEGVCTSNYTKVHVTNLVNQAAVFYVRIALKVVYEHLRFEKIFPGFYPEPPLKGEGRHGERKEGRECKEMVPSRFNLVPCRFPWASYGPECMSALRMCD
jgi:hypothetical protein